jgi:hypothetical protein
MSPAPATIFYLTILNKSLKNPNPLTTIPGHQPKHHHHLSPSIITFLTSSTLNMSNETLKSGHGDVPKQTAENYSVRKQKIRRVLIAKKAYNIVTGVEPLPPGNSVPQCALQDDWHDRANKGIALIHVRCCDELFPLIDDVDDHVEMWEALWDRLDNASMKLGHTQVLRKFTASCPSPDKTVTHYFTKLISFRKKLISTTKNITDDAMKTHIFTTLSNSYETTIHIVEQRIPAPSAQECMDAIRQYAQRMTRTKAIKDASTGAALYYRRVNHVRGAGGAGRGGGRENGCQKQTCTYCKMDNHTTEACGKRKCTENDTGDTNTSRNDERTCYQ